MAYVLYKQDKIGFIEATATAHGRAPTDDELKVFHAQTCDPAKIQEYRAQAMQLWDASLKIVVKNKMQEFEATVQAGIVNGNVLAVLAELQSKRGARAWFADIFANLGVNVATILLVGFLIGGYQTLSNLNTALEKISNIPSASEASSGGSAPANGPASTGLVTSSPKPDAKPPG